MAGSTNKIFILPIAMVAWFFVVFLIAYIMAVISEDILIFLPNVSDIGARIPESCIFSTIFNIGGFLLIVTAYLRYLHVAEAIKTTEGKHLFVYVNLASFAICVLAGIGLTVAGNFSETQWFVFHITGIGSALFLASTYLVLQAVLCFFLSPNLCAKWMTFARMGTSGFCFFCCMIALISGAISYSAYNGQDISKWKSDAGGYTSHVISAMAEWATCILLLVFLLSFAYDFKSVEFCKSEIAIQEADTTTPAAQS